jgi:hypothetical protein
MSLLDSGKLLTRLRLVLETLPSKCKHSLSNLVEQISAMMVLPNKLPIVLSEEVPPQTIKTPEPAVRIYATNSWKVEKLSLLRYFLFTLDREFCECTW